MTDLADLTVLERMAPLMLFDTRERYWPLAVDGTPGVIYGRRVTEGPDTWLQYWAWYTMNWSRFKGRHAGDWEMLQILLDADGKPDRVAVAQHAHGQLMPWTSPSWSDGHPVMYIASGTHATYTLPGWHRRTRVSLEPARGNGKRLLPVVWAPAEDGWASAPRGRWGMDKHSPVAPGRHQQWTQPTRWAARLA